jgi:hypothetical protein
MNSKIFAMRVKAGPAHGTYDPVPNGTWWLRSRFIRRKWPMSSFLCFHANAACRHRIVYQRTGTIDPRSVDAGNFPREIERVWPFKGRDKLETNYL